MLHGSSMILLFNIFSVFRVSLHILVCREFYVNSIKYNLYADQSSKCAQKNFNYKCSAIRTVVRLLL